jgi:type I restriction enzyme, S subunit
MEKSPVKDEFSRLTSVQVRSEQLYADDYRLDGAFYEGQWAHLAIQNAPYKKEKLGELADFIYIPRFKRNYVSNGGVPFIGSKEMLLFPLSATKHLAKTMPIIPKLLVEPNWILVSCSGTIGQTVLSHRAFIGYGISQHVLRIIPKRYTGYLTAFLLSKYGQILMTSNQFGAVVNEITPKHLSTLPIPLIAIREIERIDTKVKRAATLRCRGMALLQKADVLLHKFVELPSFDSLTFDYLKLQDSQLSIACFSIRSDSLGQRLDASYHIPEVKRIHELFKTLNVKTYSLGDLAEGIIIPPRFKRIFVKEGDGIRYVRPTDVIMLRPLDQQFISKRTKELPQLKLKEGEVLIATDGAVGNVSYSTKYMEGWAGSNNLGRIRTGSQLDAGYLTAFLNTPYGQYQIQREIYGGVIDHLEKEHIAGVQIPLLDHTRQQEIGMKVKRAYELRDKASQLEAEAVAALESAIAA